MVQKILIAEDNQEIIDVLILYLENDGFEVIVVNNGVDALEVIKSNTIDLAILDVMMPRMDGFNLTKKLREFSNIPIIILSAKNQDSDKILGLNIGADDYLTKPFNPLEIIARIKSNLRRYSMLEMEIKDASKLMVGELNLDLDIYKLTKSGKEIILTPTEYKILALLMKSPGRIYTKVQIYENINGDYFRADDNTLMVHISKLREKIEDDAKKPKYIKTVRGLGYKIEG
ncbi:MAG: response regulator transcription factor [Clostridium sp.]